jgi:carbamoyl-phosphate synthase small subunit
MAARRCWILVLLVTSAAGRFAAAAPVRIDLGGPREAVVTIDEDGERYRLEVDALAVQAFDGTNNREANRTLARSFAITALTRHLQLAPTQQLSLGGVEAGPEVAADMEAAKAKALAAAKAFPGLVGMDLAQKVTCDKSYEWKEGSWQLGSGHSVPAAGKHHVVAYDFGVKRNILRMLVDRGCKVTVVPAKTTAADVLAMQPDGIFLSNGPGDPEPCDYAIAAIKSFLQTDIPMFGICLGHQLLGLATGAKTVKMPTGHHGANHPVKDLATSKVFITSQNHGFAVDESSLPANVKPTHKSLFDGTLQGIHLTDKPAFGFQGHPEASPGPHDIAPVFDHFIELMEQGNVAR